MNFFGLCYSNVFFLVILLGSAPLYTNAQATPINLARSCEGGPACQTYMANLSPESATNYPPGNGNDGATNLFVNSEGTGPLLWWRVDLQYTVVITSLKYTARTSCCQDQAANAVIVAGDDGGSPLAPGNAPCAGPIPLSSLSSAPNTWQSPDTLAGCKGRYVFVYKNYTAADPVLAFTELEVYGACPAGTYYANGVCTKCSAGTQSLAVGATSVGTCASCPAGKTSTAGSAHCYPLIIPTGTPVFRIGSSFEYYAEFRSTTSVTLTVNAATTFQALVVGGGGSGGHREGAGGGAGAMIYVPSIELQPGSYVITAGAGGAAKPAGQSSAGVTWWSRGNPGGDTIITKNGATILLAKGGGYGAGGGTDSGGPGGSVGGSKYLGCNLFNPYNTENEPDGVFGNRGGCPCLTYTAMEQNSGAGGGGAGSAGGNSSCVIGNTRGGDGGAPLISTISGSSNVYAAGGGGGGWKTMAGVGAGGGTSVYNTYYTPGGRGARGYNAAYGNYIAPSDGLAGTGSGGGGGGFDDDMNSLTGAGGTGIVVLRWAAQAQPCVEGTFSNDGLPPCTQCPANTYSSSPGATSCTSCPYGTFTSGTGATAESACTRPAPVNGACEANYWLDGPSNKCMRCAPQLRSPSGSSTVSACVCDSGK